LTEIDERATNNEAELKVSSTEHRASYTLRNEQLEKFDLIIG